MQDDYECFFFVASWHALTTDAHNSGQAPESTIEMAADWLGAGLDPQRPATTWSGFTADCATITKATKATCFALGNKEGAGIQFFLSAFGSGTLTPQEYDDWIAGKRDWNSPHVKQIFQLWKDVEARGMNSKGGNWQEQVIVPARQVVPVAAAVPDEQAASFFVNPATALVLTRWVLRVPAGAWLLQTAAGSALGRMIIRLGKRHGALAPQAIDPAAGILDGETLRVVDAEPVGALLAGRPIGELKGKRGNPSGRYADIEARAFAVVDLGPFGDTLLTHAVGQDDAAVAHALGGGEFERRGIVRHGFNSEKVWDHGLGRLPLSPWRVERGLGPGPSFGETRRNRPQQARRKALVLKGFLSIGVFHRVPKYRRVVLTPQWLASSSR